MRFIPTNRLGTGRRGVRILGILALLCAVVAQASPCLCGADCDALGGTGFSLEGTSLPGDSHGCCARDAGQQTGEAPASPDGGDDCCGCCFSAPQDLPVVSPTLLVDMSPLPWVQVPGSGTRMSVANDDVIVNRNPRLPIPGRPVYLRLNVLRI